MVIPVKHVRNVELMGRSLLFPACIDGLIPVHGDLFDVLRQLFVGVPAGKDIALTLRGLIQLHRRPGGIALVFVFCAAIGFVAEGVSRCSTAVSAIPSGSTSFTEGIRIGRVPRYGIRRCVWLAVPCAACVFAVSFHAGGDVGRSQGPLAIVQEDQDLQIRRGPIRPGAVGNVEGHNSGLVQHVRRAIPVFVISPQRVHGFVPVGDRDMSQQLRGIKCAVPLSVDCGVLLRSPADPHNGLPIQGTMSGACIAQRPVPGKKASLGGGAVPVAAVGIVGQSIGLADIQHDIGQGICQLNRTLHRRSTHQDLIGISLRQIFHLNGVGAFRKGGVRVIGKLEGEGFTWRAHCAGIKGASDRSQSHGDGPELLRQIGVGADRPFVGNIDPLSLDHDPHCGMKQRLYGAKCLLLESIGIGHAAGDCACPRIGLCIPGAACIARRRLHAGRNCGSIQGSAAAGQENGYLPVCGSPVRPGAVDDPEGHGGGFRP